MKLQELINKLSNLLASGAGEADVKIDGKDIKTAIIQDVLGVKTLVITRVE
jgi:hypothetical protein